MFFFIIINYSMYELFLIIQQQQQDVARSCFT